jgi:hypothetical protein
VDLGSSKSQSLATQITQTSKTAGIISLFLSVPFHPLARHNQPMLNWLLLSPRKQKSNKLAVKGMLS